MCDKITMYVSLCPKRFVYNEISYINTNTFTFYGTTDGRRFCKKISSSEKVLRLLGLKVLTDP